MVLEDHVELLLFLSFWPEMLKYRMFPCVSFPPSLVTEVGAKIGHSLAFSTETSHDPEDGIPIMIFGHGVILGAS